MDYGVTLQSIYIQNAKQEGVWEALTCKGRAQRNLHSKELAEQNRVLWYSLKQESKVDEFNRLSEGRWNYNIWEQALKVKQIMHI